MSVELSDERRSELVLRLQGFFLEQFEEELSEFRAEHLLDFVLEAMGPQVYNQAVQDARVFMQRKLEDLEGEVWMPLM